MKHNVFTSYQVGGAHLHLAAPLNKQVSDGLTAALDSATVFPYFDDPFKLSVAYAYVAKSIKEPPDCMLQYIWAMSWHFFWAFCYVFRGTCRLKYNLDSKYITQTLGQDLPDLSNSTKPLVVHCFATGGPPDRDIISFDSDGIPFIVDSGSDCIINCIFYIPHGRKAFLFYICTRVLPSFKLSARRFLHFMMELSIMHSPPLTPLHLILLESLR